MRFLVLTACGGNLFGYSPVEMSKALITFAIDRGETCYFDWVMPEPDGKNWKFEKEKIESMLSGDRNRIKFHYIPMLKSALNSVYMATRDLYELFNIQKTMHFYDAVINLWIPFSPVLKGVLKTKYEMMSVDVPVINISTRVLNFNKERLSKYNQYGESTIVAEMLGYLFDYSIFLLESERELFFELCRKYLRFDKVKELMDKTAAFTSAGLRTNSIGKVYEKRKDRPAQIPTMYFGGRFTSMKRFEDVLKITKSVFEAGKNIKGICSTAEYKTKEELETLHAQYPMIDFYASITKEEFYEKLIEGDFFICLSTTESFGTAYWEMLYCGIVGVFLDAPYVREVLPDDYPFVAKSEKDVPGLISLLVDMLKTDEGKDKINRYIESSRERLRAKYDIEREAHRMYDWIVEKTELYWAKHFKYGGSLFELAKEAANSFEGEFTFDEVMTRMTEMSEHGRVFGRKGDFINRFLLRRLVINAGYIDTCKESFPTFKKRD